VLASTANLALFLRIGQNLLWLLGFHTLMESLKQTDYPHVDFVDDV